MMYNKMIIKRKEIWHGICNPKFFREILLIRTKKGFKLELGVGELWTQIDIELKVVESLSHKNWWKQFLVDSIILIFQFPCNWKPNGGTFLKNPANDILVS